MLFGLVLAAVACDVAQFIQDPKPRLVETWNLPASSSTISVGKLLPTGVAIYSTPASTPPDSIAFSVSIASTTISRVLGPDCPQCVTLNGTSAPKPSFVLNATNSTPLPNNVVSGAITGGQVTLNITNNLSFDPLYINTAPGATTQGDMLITIRSGSMVLGTDSVRGSVTNQLPPGAVMNRTIPLSSGVATTNVTADLVFKSPLGDHNVPINANSTINASFGVPSLRVGNVRINVPNTNITPGAPTDLPKDLDPSMTKRVIKGALEMTVTNPFGVTGNLSARFAYGPAPAQTLTKPFALPGGAAPQVASVSFDSTEMVNIFSGKPTSLTMTGAVASTVPITVTPKQAVVISNRLILSIRVGGT
jgi:hypothetical protein